MRVVFMGTPQLAANMMEHLFLMQSADVEVRFARLR